MSRRADTSLKKLLALVGSHKRLLSMVAFLALLWFSPRQGCAVAVTRISWDSQPTMTRFLVELDQEAIVNAVDAIREKGFYYVDIYGVATAYKRRIMDIDDKFVRQVESISYPDHGVLRFVFYVKPAAAAFRVSSEKAPFRLYIDTLDQSPATTGTLSGALQAPAETDRSRGLHVPSSAPSESQPIVIRDRAPNRYIPPIPEPPTEPIRSARSRGAKKVVIIDPGHGGANQGAVSTALVNGRQVYEKELTLQFAYHLKKVIDSSPNMVAILTRTRDTLLPLSDRVAIAEKQKGDLFISIHMNDGAGNPNARGFEIFYLSEKGADDAAARAVAERENIDILTNGKTASSNAPLLAQVLTDLERQRLENWQYESYLVSSHIVRSLQQHPYFRAWMRGIKSANFVVLKNFYMPAVLVEVGFITNAEELRYLVNPKFQKLTAILIYNAINEYFSQTDPTFQPDRRPMSAALE